nr:hypothetical protein [Candidatus Krumholzibacteria bacterium]
MAIRIWPRSNSARALVIVLIGFVLLVLLVLGYFLVLVSSFAGSSQQHDSDETLIKRFHEHRDALEQLQREVSAEPGMANVHRDGIWPENLFDPDHVAAYREQLHRINLTNRFRIARDGSMEFTASSGGNVQHSSEKGYAYLVTAPDSLCLDLDEASKRMRPFPHRGWTGYRHIEGNWYLYFTGD